MFYTHVFPRKVVVLLTSKNDQRKHARHPYRPKDDDDAFRAAAVPFVVFPQSHPESFL